MKTSRLYCLWICSNPCYRQICLCSRSSLLNMLYC